MKKWNLVIDLVLCHDCNDCFLADKDEFVGNDFPPYSAGQPWHGHRWMNIERAERGQYPIVQTAYLPKPCQHCDDAPCLTADGAVYKREDGLVIIDPVKAKGRKEILDSCPYEVIYWNEEAQLPQKCTGCAHLIDQGWTDTRCSQVCPTGAIKLVLADDAEMAQTAAAEDLEAFRADLGTTPRVYYKNLHRWTKAFLAANVVCKDTDENADGAHGRRGARRAEGGRGDDQQLRRLRGRQARARQGVHAQGLGGRVQAGHRGRDAGREQEPGLAVPGEGLTTGRSGPRHHDGGAPAPQPGAGAPPFDRSAPLWHTARRPRRPARAAPRGGAGRMRGAGLSPPSSITSPWRRRGRRCLTKAWAPRPRTEACR